MNVLLWIGQALLSIIFLVSGVNKATLSEKQLIAKGQTGVVGIRDYVIHSIGVMEILGAVGVIVPWITGIMPVFTPVAAICFSILMLLAAPIHYRLKEPRNVLINILIFILAVFVAIGRGQEL